MSKPEEEFKLIVSDDPQVNMHNRINAIERIKFLSGVDLRERPKEYRYRLDHELYNRMLKNKPKDTKIDEEWCQMVATVIKDLESGSTPDPAADVQVEEEIGLLYRLVTKLRRFYGKIRKT